MTKKSLKLKVIDTGDYKCLRVKIVIIRNIVEF